MDALCKVCVCVRVSSSSRSSSQLTACLALYLCSYCYKQWNHRAARWWQRQWYWQGNGCQQLPSHMPALLMQWWMWNEWKVCQFLSLCVSGAWCTFSKRLTIQIGHDRRLHVHCTALRSKANWSEVNTKTKQKKKKTKCYRVSWAHQDTIIIIDSWLQSSDWHYTGGGSKEWIANYAAVAAFAAAN